jgi:PKHD-type hydroxylase|tara:strand:+ start:488 stop:1117 length:630 start_codon:yes stop_codon:yes gene_type:complete
MKLSNHYWYFKSALTPKFCDDVIKHGLNNKESLARIGSYNDKKLTNDQIKDIKKKRNSDITWLDDTWIYKEIHPYVHEANKSAGWNFEWDRSEPCQFTKYKLGQYYDWHCDSWSEAYKEKGPTKGKIRKLSVTCQLTDGSEYEGGELEFDFKDYEPHMRDEDKHLKQANEILSKGSIIVFPSHLWHRVKPVMKGIRYSLVLWNLGYPFK